MNRLFLLIGFSLFWSGATVAQIFEDGFENHPDAVEVLSFSATPNPVVVGNSTTLAWTIKDADDCIPTDGTAAWRALNIDPFIAGGDFEVVGLAEGVHTFTLTCTGPIGDPSFKVVQILVEAAPPACTDPDLTGSTETITWPTFYLAEFPDIDLGLKPNGDPRDSRLLQVFATGFRAVEFHTADVINTGLFELPENEFVAGERLGVVTKCLGRFDNVPAACTFVWDTNSGGITWSTEGAPGACQLDADSTYYLNVTFTDGVDPDSTSCGPAEDCFATIKHTLIP